MLHGTKEPPYFGIQPLQGHANSKLKVCCSLLGKANFLQNILSLLGCSKCTQTNGLISIQSLRINEMTKIFLNPNFNKTIRLISFMCTYFKPSVNLL